MGTFMLFFLSWLIRHRYLEIPGNRMLQVCLLTLKDVRFQFEIETSSVTND
jgi:hypothetical protein